MMSQNLRIQIRLNKFRKISHSMKMNQASLRRLRNLEATEESDVDRRGQQPIDVKLGPTTRAEKKKLKILEVNEANGNNLMVKMAKYGRKGTLLLMVPLPLVAGRLLPSIAGKISCLPTTKRMGAKSKQDDCQSKLTRDMHNFYYSGCNGFNAYNGNNHGYGNFTPKRYNGVGNFSSYANSFEHTSYDDYGDYGRVNTRYDSYKHTPYDCYEKVMNNASIESIVVGFGLGGALFDILHDKYFYLKELLLKDFENQMGTYLELIKVNPLAFEKSILRNEAFERICKYFVVEHLYYHKPFKDWFLNLFILQNGTFLGYVVSFLGFEVGENMVQAIHDWLISKSAVEEKSFYGLATFYRKYIKDFSSISSSLMDVPEKKAETTWIICLFLIDFASNQAYYSTTLSSSLGVDYGFKLLMSFDLIPFYKKYPTANGSPAPTITSRLRPGIAGMISYLPPTFLIKGLMGILSYYAVVNSSKRSLRTTYRFGCSKSYKALDVETWEHLNKELRAHYQIITIGIDIKCSELELNNFIVYGMYGTATILNGAFYRLVDHGFLVDLPPNTPGLTSSIFVFDITKNFNLGQSLHL
ncbi:hypothetical protein M9H77_08728 [Catharanthus roseus]|uniref:Uncharacterized protein n=1 Tax=Catharanthus roseus TaxID=4058 RepID=A0ACC0BYX9_CATRO|nr:hypothetical protein M9H77_08728 [Catharanthus roseus]